ncbi:MAG: hypothetical protein FRX48_08932 [Lasallia pustulata]|uniref:Uncharacterized protein n=1 Tax=Lasallia pustulata TaxID=136370 RepID=A0A5M8PEP2_9LECA|nr:MAG: hypothetical protein FRX48_08932 [Lasallia pustulata]
MARGPLPGRSTKSPEHYRKAKPATQRHRNGFDKLAPSSKFTYGGTLRKLQQYCAYIGDPLEPLNPPDFLKTATADTLCNFMEWSLNNSAIMKLDVVMNAFESIRYQVMGHKWHRVFEKHYSTAEVTWDVQSTYRGAVQQKDLVLATGNKLLLRDSRAPIKLAEEREIEILKHPSVIALQDARQCLLKQCQNEYGRVKARYEVLQ